jgi:protein phosphatase
LNTRVADSPDSTEEFRTKLIDALSSASLVLKNERTCGRQADSRVCGELVQISSAQRVAVIGDIHGDRASLARILESLNRTDFFAEPRNKLVFLGDYVDRGSDSLGVLYTVASLKAQYPDSIVLLRGNHESPVELPFASHDLPYQVMTRFGARDSHSVYREILAFFDLLSLGAIVEGFALLVHGGLPVASVHDPIKTISQARENHNSDSCYEEILWNDPRDLPAGMNWERSRRGYGKHFGQAVTDSWIAETGTKVLIRGHEPCLGYRTDHKSKVLTLFSTVEAYPRFKAAYLDIGSKEIEKVSDCESLLKYVHVLDT